MQLPEDALFLRIYLGESDRWQHQPLHEAIVMKARELHLAGAFIAAVTGGEFTGRWRPPFWVARFGPDSLALHGVVGFLGGILMAFGARFAGGCTSGHGISGTLQSNVGSWISVVCFFIGGIAVAFPLYLL
ncbi:MAG: DUF190 domain-containing protein [Chthoniobacterales bacterium]